MRYNIIYEIVVNFRKILCFLWNKKFKLKPEDFISTIILIFIKKDKVSKISDEFIVLRDQKINQNKKYRKIFDLIDKAKEQEGKGNFFDASDFFEKAAEIAGKLEDEEMIEKLTEKIEECMIKGEEKREKLDKMFSIWFLF